MQNNGSKDKIGKLKISEEVIATIASLAASDVAGVAALVPNTANLKGYLRKNPSAKAVKIELNDNIAIINVYVKLKFGAKIPAVADGIQRNVKESVQNMTGIAVSRVNVFISGLSLDDVQVRS